MRENEAEKEKESLEEKKGIRRKKERFESEKK